MRVEALRIENGFFIPMIEQLKEVQQDKILLDIEIVESLQNNLYAPFDGLIGLCETNRSVKHIKQTRNKTNVSIPIEKILEMTGTSENCWSDSVIKEREECL